MRIADECAHPIDRACNDAYEYIVLVTNTDLSLSAVAQAYRDRADCENVFDEIKNQWFWAVSAPFSTV